MTRRASIAVGLVAAALAGVAPSAAAAPRSVLSGAVRTGAAPLPGSSVALFAAGRGAPRRLGTAVTGARGDFRITYARPSGAGILYVIATGGGRAAGRAVQLLSVAGSVTRPLGAVTVNELTTVGSAYALAQFAHGAAVRGASPGLENAAATALNLIAPAGGGLSPVIATPPNRTDTNTAATLRTLANVIAGCTRGTPRSCLRLFLAARPPGGRPPATTLQAVLAIAHNPTHRAAALFALAKASIYTPALSAAPAAWVLSIKYTAGGFNGPGRMAFDSRGNVWVTNNFAPPAPRTSAGFGLISLGPTGRPINHSPIMGGGLEGVWWGIGIDQHDHVWTSNYTGADTTPFTSPDFTGGTNVSEFNDKGVPLSPPTGFTAGAISAPQGIAVDQQGNVWIANHVGNSVTEYPGGNPHAARVFVSGSGALSKPFAIAIDGRGTKWVTVNAISNTLPGMVTRIDAGGDVLPAITGGGLSSPQGLAVDQRGNVWVANLQGSTITEISPNGQIDPRSPLKAPSLVGPWSIAVDGDGNLWVASFIGQTLTELCGANTAACPPGAHTGDVLSPAPADSATAASSI